MKNYFFTIAMVLILCQAMGQNWTDINSSVPTPASKELISSNTDNSTIRFRVDGFYMQTVVTSQGEAVLVSLDKATPILAEGAPDLPKVTASVIIPDLASMEIKVLDAEYTDFQNVLVAPSKGNLTRDIDPATVPYTFGPEYQADAFYPGTLTGLREPYIIRDFRGQTVIAYPFQYNPVTRVLRVYHDITLKLTKKDENGVNPLIRTEPLDKIDADFNIIYQRHFLNASNGTRYTPVPEFGNILIISYGAFMTSMEPYIAWKKQVGYPVEMVDVGSIGNSTAIKSFIANYYNSKGLTFVLLVGDAAQVPSSSTSAGDSDNDYSYIVGGDHYPDLFVGRFSAETVDQVNTQVERTIEYEQNPLTETDWFTICTGVASDQGPGDDGEYDYQHVRNIQLDLLAFTYTYDNELFDGSQGGHDAAGNPTPAQVATAIDAGTSIINYTGHGSTTSWGSSGFSNSDVNNLVNDNMLPFVWSVACLNGNFVGSTCFAEAWLRATNNGEPTGAVAFLGSTINQSWDPPMAGQDEMNDILVESYPDNINRTFGALSMHGCMLMNDEYGAGGDEMTDTWTCFGDPSLMVRTAVPATMTVTHDPILFIGMNQLVITGGVDGARATLSEDGTILATGVIEGGTVTLEFAELDSPTTLTLTITAFNYLPYITTIDVIPADGPFLTLEDYDINDEEGGNGNGLIDYNEDIMMGLNMENVGVEDAVDVTVTISTSDPYITITDDTEVYDTVPAGGTLFIPDGFSFLVSSDIPDQHAITFDISSSDGDATWQSTFLANANAPILHINALTIDDTENGNGDGELDPGEQAVMTINYSNTGHAVAYNVDIYLEGQSGYVEVLNPNQNFASLGFLGIFNKSFDVTIDEETPEGIMVNFMNELTMGQFEMSKDNQLKISAKCEDFETGNFSKFNWQNAGDAPWTITNLYPFEGYFSVKSGTISGSQTSELKITYQVGAADSITFYRKVSSEENSDRLQFYIGNTLIEEWSGMKTWMRMSYPVSPGTKTFRWVYIKNASGNAGSDCAWLDLIHFPPPNALTLWTGPDDEACSGDPYQLNQSYGTQYSLIDWNSSGTGSFDDNTIMHPVYYPSADDIEEGQVVLSMTLTDEGGNSVSDEMNLAYKGAPDAPAVPSGPDYVDLTITTTSEYTTEGIDGATDYQWYLSPVEAGTIDSYGTVSMVNWDPGFMGTAYITVAGINECGEGIQSEALEVTVDNTVGIGERSDNSNFLVYPNPTSGLLNIQAIGISGNLDISVFDLLGSVVYEQQNISLNGSGTVKLDLSSLPTGMYVLSLANEQQRRDMKLVVR